MEVGISVVVLAVLGSLVGNSVAQDNPVQPASAIQLMTPAKSVSAASGTEAVAVLPGRLDSLPDGLALDLPVSLQPTAAARFEGRLRRVQRHGNGIRTFLGELAGGGEFGLAIQGNTVVGSIQSPDGSQYQFSPAPKVDTAGNLLCAVSQSSLDSLVRYALDDRAIPPAVQIRSRRPLVASAEQNSGGCADPSRIDLLVVYTNLARAAAGSAEAIEAQVQTFLDYTNLACANSLVDLQFNLVHISEVQYNESSGSFQTFLTHLATPRDGYLQEVDGLRDRYGADAVCLMVESNAQGGIAYLMGGDLWACSVISRRINPLHNLAHELGHNLDCNHDRENATNASKPYAYGYRYQGASGTQWRTVMAYAPGNVNGRFSNPNVLFDGVPTGSPLDSPLPAYNALVLMENRGVVANYRASILADCNGNGRPDGQDIEEGLSHDANADGIPDECEQALFVDDDAPVGGDGRSWATAFRDLHEAIRAAQACCYVTEIWVAEGTYKPAPAGGSRDIAFTPKAGAILYGGFAGTESSLAERNWADHPTILSGDLNSDDLPAFVNRADNSYNVVRIPRHYRKTAIDGFIIRAGNADDTNHGRGAGIYVDHSTAEIRNCVIEDCSSLTEGGGVCLYLSEGSVLGCVLRGNTVSFMGGGAISCGWPSGPVRIANSSFEGNYAPRAGGAIWTVDDAMTLTVDDCSFTGNSVSTSSGAGGAMSVSAKAVQLDRCRFEGNRAYWGGAVHFGVAAAGVPATRGRVCSCSFVGNSTSFAAGLLNTDSVAEFVNCTFTANRADLDGLVIQNARGTTSLANSIVWQNAYPGYSLETDTVKTAVTYSDLETTRAGTGNKALDPKFIRPASSGADRVWGTADDDYGDLRLQASSPCLDAGNNEAIPAGYLHDLAGKVRVFDAPGIPNTGNPIGAPQLVDMGCYELVTTIAGDFDDDADIDDSDLLLFIDCASGPAVPFAAGCSSRDLDEDSDVDVADFAVLQRCISGDGHAADPNCGD